MIHNVDHQTNLQPSRWPHNSAQQHGAKEIQLTKDGESPRFTLIRFQLRGIVVHSNGKSRDFFDIGFLGRSAKNALKG
jgi:hypothetical protein